MQIGCDIVEVERIESALEKHGERFAKRILTDEEFDVYQNHAKKIHFLARRFAAKEAIAKALGTGIGEDFSFHDVTIRNTDKGRPVVKPHARVYEIMKESDIRDISLTISDERHYAMAVALLVE